MVKKNKPFPVWPIWLVALILIFLSSNPTISAGILLGALIGSGIIYKHNVRKFGKGYKRRMKEEKKNAIPRT